MEHKYLLIRVEKPLTPNSRIFGKYLPIKDWVKQRFHQKSESVFMEISKKTFIFEEEKCFVVFCRAKADFAKIITKFMEQQNEKDR